MDEDAELGIAEPLRRLIRAETLPVIAERAFRCRFVDISQQALAFTVVFAVGRGPLCIDLLRRQRGGCWCRSTAGRLPCGAECCAQSGHADGNREKRREACVL